MLGFARFCVFDGDMEVLVKQKAAHGEAFKQALVADAQAKGAEVPTEAEMGLGSLFRGYADFISPANEITAWQLIARAAEKRLAEYANGPEEDVAMLAGMSGQLAKEQENCYKLRYADKTLLLFLEETATGVETLLGKSHADALEDFEPAKHSGANAYYATLIRSLEDPAQKV